MTEQIERGAPGPAMVSERPDPLSNLLDSALYHMFAFMDGNGEEDHLALALRSIGGLVWIEQMKRLGRPLPSLTDKLP